MAVRRQDYPKGHVMLTTRINNRLITIRTDVTLPVAIKMLYAKCLSRPVVGSTTAAHGDWPAIAYGVAPLSKEAQYWIVFNE